MILILSPSPFIAKQVQHYKEDISKMARKNDPVANIRQINNIITRDHQRKDILKKNEEKKQDICDEKVRLERV